MKKIIITGVAGLIGSRMAEWIVDKHKEIKVIGIDNLSGGYQDYIPKGIEFHSLDLVNADLNLIFQDVEIVYHFAAYAAEGLSPFIRKFNYTNNLVATANVVNTCIQNNVKRLVFTSSMAVYGIGNPPFQEDHLPSPIDPYGVAKYACEMDIQIAGEQHKLDWCIIRPHNVYGRNQNIWDKYRNVLGIWMYQHLNGKPLSIFGDGSQRRAFTPVEDCLEPLWVAGNSKLASKQIINLGSWKHYTILDAAQTLIRTMGGGDIQFLEGRHEVKHALPGYERSVELLGYQDQTDLASGLSNMWIWAQKQPNRIQKYWDHYEIDKGIYGFWK